MNKKDLKAKSSSSLLLFFVATLVCLNGALAQPNPYQVIYHWGELPGDRAMGVVTGVQPDPDGQHI